MANSKSLHDVSLLTKDFHVWPDFHGNRSPLADPTMKGMIVGLTINSSEENLALLYLATMQALAVVNFLYKRYLHDFRNQYLIVCFDFFSVWYEAYYRCIAACRICPLQISANLWGHHK